MSGRIFQNCQEAISEVERELFEFGIEVAGHSYQDKVHEGDPGMVTKELQAYSFSVMDPDPEEALECVVQWYSSEVRDWLWAEFKERVSQDANPGNAWRLRQDVWEQFLEKDGRFSYTYSERMSKQLDKMIWELKKHPYTRQAIIEMHNNISDIDSLGGKRRIPCTLQYQFLIRNDKMSCIYMMRSSDFLTHFVNDLTLAVLLQDHMRTQVNKELGMGQFDMFVSSLHCFKRDMAAKGIF